MNRVYLGVFLFSSAVSLSCTGTNDDANVGTNSGNPIGDGALDEIDWVNCYEELRRNAIAPEDETSMGFTGGDVVRQIEGQNSATLQWGAIHSEQEEASVNGMGGITGIEGLGSFTLVPEAGPAIIVIEVNPDIDSLVLVEFKPLENSEVECPRELLLEAQIKVTSDNGAFDETFAVTFSAKETGIISTVVELTPGQLNGSFDVELGNSDAVIARTVLNIEFEGDNLQGNITSIITTPGDEWGIIYGEIVADE